jgi:hypothetical protein
MNRPIRIAPIWRDLYAGDSFFSAKPYHALLATAEELKAEGYAYLLEPALGGYIVRCTESPLKSLEDGFIRATQT